MMGIHREITEHDNDIILDLIIQLTALSSDAIVSL